MVLPGLYDAARRDEHIARLRRMLALRAMSATGMSQRHIAAHLAVSQAAVSQQLRTACDLSSIHPETLLEAAAPILKQVAESRGFTELAVFGSVARHQASAHSDVDLLVRQPPGTSIKGMITLRDLFERILGRPVDLVTYGGLKEPIDADIRREVVLL